MGLGSRRYDPRIEESRPHRVRIPDSRRGPLATALGLDSEVVALTIEDREPILWALEDTNHGRSSGVSCSRSTSGVLVRA